MKSILRLSVVPLWIGLLFYTSCAKEYSCEGCIDGNKPPIAKAGSDEIITLPTDSVSLDGSSSSDPDGMISSFLWTKISGPSSFNIIRSTDSITKVKALVAGIYEFELTVTDNGGLSVHDTMRVIVDSALTTNRPPVANAGADQTITLPVNSVNLDGSGSTDPDNNIANYLWTKISGPSSFNIVNVNEVQSQVTNLVQGIYEFELSVIDTGGLFAKDTVEVIVNAVTGDSSDSNVVPDIIISLPLDSLYIWGTFEAWWSLTVYEWTQLSGPTVITTNPGAMLFATQLIPGFYSFRVESSAAVVDTINVSVIDDPQDPNTITFKNLKWLLADEYGIGFTDLSLRFPPQPSLFIMPGYQLRPLEVYLQIDPASPWFQVPFVQSGASYTYDSNHTIWIMRLPVDETWVGKKSSIKVKLL